MRIRNKSTYQICNRLIAHTAEGNKVPTLKEPFTISAYIYKASGQMATQLYGQELKYIFNMLTDEPYNPTIINGKLYYSNGVNKFAEGDRIHVFNSEEPDFEIISIAQHGHLEIVLEMLH